MFFNTQAASWFFNKLTHEIGLFQNEHESTQMMDVNIHMEIGVLIKLVGWGRPWLSPEKVRAGSTWGSWAPILGSRLELDRPVKTKRGV